MASGGTTRVFLARLAGLTVLDPNADLVGRVRDVVVVLRAGAQPPRVLSLVVEVQPRRRGFVPMGQITTIDADSVIVRGRINLRRVERGARRAPLLPPPLPPQGARPPDGWQSTG